MSYFPMFVQLEKMPCLIVGGGRIALRKAEVLLDFGADITVVAREAEGEILALAESSRVCLREKEFALPDLDGMRLAVAATDDKALNHRVAEACRERGIPVNAVDQTEDCSFIFPAYLKTGEVVSAFCSGGQSPVITQYLKENVKPFMTEPLGELAERLGSIRETVKRDVETERERKLVYQEILKLGLQKEEVPSEDEIREILSAY